MNINIGNELFFSFQSPLLNFSDLPFTRNSMWSSRKFTRAVSAGLIVTA
jgi:hypothetical protein